MSRFSCLFAVCVAAVVSMSSLWAESAPPPAGGKERSVREALSKEALNVAAWALSGLDETIPREVRQNLIYLREDLLDEVKSTMPSNTVSYKIGNQLCGILIEALDEHDQTAVRAGYRIAQADVNPNMKVTSPDLEARRHWKFMRYWPQYYRERDQRNEIQRQVNKKDVLVKESVRVDWANRTASLRRNIDWMYRMYREALRQDPAFRDLGTASEDLLEQVQIPSHVVPKHGTSASTGAKTPDVEVPREVQDLFTPAFAALSGEERLNQVKARLENLNDGVTTRVVLKSTKNGVRVDIHGMSVTNLWPLRAIPDIHNVRMNRSRVSDLSPLRGMSLECLGITSTRVTDLSPLKDLPALRQLNCDFVPARDAEILRSIKTLDTINNQPVEEFWRKVESEKKQ